MRSDDASSFFIVDSRNTILVIFFCSILLLLPPSFLHIDAFLVFIAVHVPEAHRQIASPISCEIPSHD